MIRNHNGLRMALLLIVSGMLIGFHVLAEDVKPHHLVGHEEAELLLRIQDVIDDWDPRKLENPLVTTSQAAGPDGNMTAKKQLRRSDLAEFIADVDAAEALGKAFFWEMQAGSDFEVIGTGDAAVATGTACASCHYRHGADARNRHTRRIPYVAWDQYKLHPSHPLEFGETQQPYPVSALSTETIPPPPAAGHFGANPAGPLSRIIGSQGVAPRVFEGFKDEAANPHAWKREEFEERSLDDYEYRPDWSMFIEGNQSFRQITTRNSPTVINSGFSDRLFHDGRAESTFNGFSIFGDFDQRDVIHRVKTTPRRDAEGQITNDPPLVEIVPVTVAITHAALASQAVGPIVNDVEMSYLGRQFPHVAHKLLTANVLGFQNVDASDSVLSRFRVGKQCATCMTYEDLIKRAFRSEWWDDSGARDKTPLVLLRGCSAEVNPTGSLMEGNFSLYWGLSIMLYEASLVSNHSPFDEMMRGRPEMVEAKWQKVKADLAQPIRRDQHVATPPRPAHESGSAIFQHGFRVFMNRGCVDCHDGPFFSELYERQPEAEPLPIHYTLERALLPNSRSDALVANLRQAREVLLKNLSDAVAKIPDAKSRSGKIAIELEELRHATYGRRAEMGALVSKFLQANFSENVSVEEEITTLLFEYEKSLVRRMGRRTFFTEDERVAMAEALGGPVLVEKMAIPPDQIPARRKLPIPGPLATEAYAFYDAGFYALGVSLPRYDRGNGGKIDLELPPIEKALLAAVETAVFEAAGVQADDPKALTRAAALEAYKTYQDTGDAQAATDGLEVAPNAAKTRFRAMVDEEQKSDGGGGGSSRVTGAPGNAYRFKRDWNTQRYQSKGYSPALNALENVPQPQDAKPRATSMKPVCDHDEGEREASVDTSWNRDDIPLGEATDDVPGPARRSSYHFLSRARQMVFDEQHWGYRKPFLHDNELAFWGTFKTPTLRNVELTAPYMHNGRLNTLMEVVEFYEDDEQQNNLRPQLPRDRTSNTDKHPAIKGLDLSIDDKRALVFFLLCLTDDRVAYEKGPFDHPSIRLVNGYKQVDGAYTEEHFDIEPVGITGRVGDPATQFPSGQ